MSPRTRNIFELRDALLKRYPEVIYSAPPLTNIEYHCVTREWVDNVFAPYFRDLLFALNKATWRKRGNQCEHFAIRAVLAAVDCFDATAQNRANITAESVSVAWIAFAQDTGVVHAIVSWFIDGQWTEWEPQNQQWLTLSAAELKTVHHPFLL